MYECFELLRLATIGLEVTAYSPFRTITQRKDKLQQEEAEIKIFQNGIENRGDGISKRESSLALIERVTDKIHDNRSSKPIRSCHH